jgi:hypothetical protein
LLFLPAHHPDGQDYFHTKQHKEEQPHLKERELVWDNCAGKGFLTDFRTDCHGKRQPKKLDEIACLDGVCQLLINGTGILHAFELGTVQADTLRHLVYNLLLHLLVSSCILC